MVNSGILVMLHITLSDVICERMMLNLSAIVMLTAGVLSILHTAPEFAGCSGPVEVTCGVPKAY